ncbi:hypothetical protein LguiB_027381 [Lonicera macranthoides]
MGWRLNQTSWQISSLQLLDILKCKKCKKLTMMPMVEAMQRLTNLRKLEISNCLLPKERFNKKSGPERQKIASKRTTHDIANCEDQITSQSSRFATAPVGDAVNARVLSSYIFHLTVLS